MMAFLAYDEEHHRIGLLSLDNYAVPERATVGLQHMSFTYDSLWTAVRELRATESEGYPAGLDGESRSDNLNFYADPDGNRLELQVDVFGTSEEADAFMSGEIYRNDPIGV